MNKKQIIILWVAIVLLVVTWGYPNWIRESAAKTKEIINLGYSPFWQSPLGTSNAYMGYINIERSMIQSLIIVLICSGLLVTFKHEK